MSGLVGVRAGFHQNMKALSIHWPYMRSGGAAERRGDRAGLSAFPSVTVSFSVSLSFSLLLFLSPSLSVWFHANTLAHSQMLLSLARLSLLLSCIT